MVDAPIAAGAQDVQEALEVAVECDADEAVVEALEAAARAERKGRPPAE